MKLHHALSLPLLMALLGWANAPEGPAVQDLESLVRDFRRAAVRQADEEGQAAARAALARLVASADADAWGSLAQEYGQCAQRQAEVDEDRRVTVARLDQARRLLEGLELRSKQDQSLAKVVESQKRSAERMAEKLEGLAEKEEQLSQWGDSLLAAGEKLLASLRASEARGIHKGLWAEVEKGTDVGARLAAVAWIGRVGGPDSCIELQKHVASLAADALRLERGLPRKEAEVRKMEARLQKESEQSGGRLSAASASQYESVKREAAQDRYDLTLMGALADACVLAGGSCLGRAKGKELDKTLAALVKAQRKARSGSRLRSLDLIAAAANEPAAAALLEILAAESEPLVIATLLEGLAPRGAGVLSVEQACEFLGHESWIVQRAAIEALVVLGRAEAVKPMIEALEGAKGRLQTDLRGGLVALTGQDYRTNVTLWSNWWRDAQEGFVVLEGRGGLGAALGAEGEVGMTFFGITTTSQRVLFLLDLSGSMNFSMVARNNPTDAADVPPDLPRGHEQSRLEAAKGDLGRALGGLRESALFNLILYASDVWTWQDELVEMEGEQRVEVQEYVQRLSASGGTNIYGALRAAFEIAGVDGGDEWDHPKIDTLFLLTDGRPSVGLTTSPREILAYVRDMNESGGIVIHTIGLSGAQDAYLLSELAKQNGGTYVGR